MSDYGEEIKKLRVHCNMTKARFAKLTGITTSEYDSIERGEVEPGDEYTARVLRLVQET